MRILLINFEMDDDSPVIAWQPAVARELAKRAQSVHVLTEKIGRYEGAANMTVDVMPRRPFGVPKRFGGGFLVNLQLWRLLRKYPCDVCFIHMAHTWAYRLWPALCRLPVLLWYAHGSVTPSLHRALACSTRAVTSTPEGLRIPSPKVHVIGQAIDTDLFKPFPRSDNANILYVGRISARKRIMLMLDVFKTLREEAPSIPWHLTLLGPTLTIEDNIYLSEVKKYIAFYQLQDQVTLRGPTTLREIAPYYGDTFLHLNLSETGSMDKTVMEALSAGCPVLTTNIAFRETLQSQPDMFSDSAEPQELAARIHALYLKRTSYNPETLRALVVGQHDLNSFGDRIMAQLQAILKA